MGLVKNVVAFSQRKRKSAACSGGSRAEEGCGVKLRATYSAYDEINVWGSWPSGAAVGPVSGVLGERRNDSSQPSMGPTVLPCLHELLIAS